MPSTVIREESFCNNNSFSSSVIRVESLTFQRKETFVFTLFTFWPPGPLLRDVANSSSLDRKADVILREFMKSQSKANLSKIKTNFQDCLASNNP